jgi:hypothetical protein
MQFVSWATLLTLLVRDLAETGSPDAAAAVRKDRLHPRQGNEDPHPETPTPSCRHCRLPKVTLGWGHPVAEASLLFLERITSRFGSSSFSGSSGKRDTGKEFSYPQSSFKLIFPSPHPHVPN